MDAGAESVQRTAVELAAPLVGGRTVVLTGSAARSEAMARFFSDAGGRPVALAIDGEIAETQARFASCEVTLAVPSAEIQGWFDAIDPAGEALVYAGSFTAVQSISGRRVIGARTQQHMAAERKDVQHELLHLNGHVIDLEAGLMHIPGPIVVRGVPDQGVAMATSHSYLIPQDAAEELVARLATALRRDCTLAVVGTVDYGRPCTFYGFVTDDAVHDLGPVEALVYWDPQSWRLHAPGIVRPLHMAEDTLAAARAEVRAAATRVRYLSGYVGAFGTDGVLADANYVVHEINPRMCAGFSLFNQLAPNAAPLAAIDLVLREFGAAASAALIEPLTVLSSAADSDPTAAYALWDKGNFISVEPSDHAAWARQVRREAAPPGLIALVDLQEFVA